MTADEMLQQIPPPKFVWRMAECDDPRDAVAQWNILAWRAKRDGQPLVVEVRRAEQ